MARSTLTSRQRRFVDEYLKCWNASEAARRAGYKAAARAIGYQVKNHPLVAEEIKRRIEESAMGADEVLHRLAEQARGSIEDFLVFVPVDGQGNVIPETPDAELPAVKPAGFRVLIDLAQARIAGKLALVRGLEYTKYGPRVELYDAQAALQLLGKHHRLFNDNLTLNIDLTKLNDEQLERIANGEDPVAVVATPSQSGAGAQAAQGATGEPTA